MDNFQEISDSTRNIDVALGMTSGGVSDSVQVGNAVLNSGYQSPLNETLSESMKRMSELSTSSFAQIYANTPDLNIGIFGRGSGRGSGGRSNNPFDGDPMFKVNNKESLRQEIDLDDYYTRMSDDWDRMDKDSDGAMVIGGGALAGAATGAAFGSLIAPGFGTVIGGVIGGILGAYEGSQVADNLGAGYVRNKNGVNEDLYARSGFWNQAGTASMKLIHSANAVNLNLASMIAYAPQAISEGSLNVMFNNKFAKLLDDYDKSSESSNRVYHTKDYDNASLLGSFTYSEMWVEKVAPALGFTVGAIAGGKGTGSILKGLGLGGTATSTATRAYLGGLPRAVMASEARALGVKSLTKGFKEAVKADLKAQTFKSLAGNTLSTLVSAAPEAGIEARGAMNESREDFMHYFEIANHRKPTSEEISNFDKVNVTTGNAVFGANMAILSASNWLQFGDLIGVDKAVREGFFSNTVKNAFGLGIKKVATAVTEKGVQQSVWQLGKRSLKQKIGYGLFKALESPITEGSQEGMQSIISGTQKDYLESRFNPKATLANKSLMSSVGDSFAHTMGSREGWEEILIGGLVGGMSSVRTRGGLDIMNIRESMGAGAKVQEDVDNLNKTSQAFTESHEDYLDKQTTYNRLNNEYVARFNDRLGASNQQMYNSDKVKQHLASGELELARTSYQNSLFAKLAAERKAGVSEESKFDVNTLVEETPDSVLKDMYGFETDEQIQEFKEETAKRLTDIHESFNAAYDMAETLNLGTGMRDFSPAQVTEMAALNFFHGMQSADNANSIARNLESIIGVDGVADALNHYSNLSEQNKERVNRLRELEEETADLNKQHSELLKSFSAESSKPVRAPQNEGVVSQLDTINKQLEGITTSIQRLEEEKNTINSILESKEGMPSLPFGNSASKFFDSTNLKFADTTSRDVLSKLTELEKYIGHLENTTGKTEEEIEIDSAKSETIKSLVTNYKSQLGLMRNFAKSAQMISDPAYVNNISKSIFNSKKYDEIFDNEDWINNNESGFSETDIAEFKELKQRLEDGEISKYDIHTYLTNAEILRTGQSTLEAEVNLDPISNFDLNSVIIQGDNGERIFDVESETGKRLIANVVQAVIDKTTLSRNQKIVMELNKDLILKQVIDIKSNKPISISDTIKEGKNSKVKEQERLKRIADEKKENVRAKFFEKYSISKILSGEVSLPTGPTLQQSGDNVVETEIVDADSLEVGDKVFYMDAVRTIKGIGTNLFGVDTLTFMDGMTVTNDITDGWKIQKVIKEGVQSTDNSSDTPLDSEMTLEEVVSSLENALNKELDKVDAEFQEAINPTTKETLEIKQALDQLNEVIDEIVKITQEENKEINSDEVDNFSKETTPIKKELNRIAKLLEIGVRSLKEQTELDGLLSKVNTYGLIEGRIQTYKNQEIRLSDLLEQRAQLENELFSVDKTVTPLTPEEMKMTFDSTTESEESLPVKEGQRVGDAAVLNNYDFVTFNKVGESYQIANLTPQRFTEEITRGKSHDIVVIDKDNNVRAVNTTKDSWDKDVQAGDSVIVEITNQDGTVSLVNFSVDNSRRIILPIESSETVSGITNLSFNAKNKIGSSNYHVLTRIDGGVETYLGSDFGIDLDTEATQRLEVGEGISFEYDNEASYNEDLEAEYNAVHPDENSIEYRIEAEVNEITAQIRENKEQIKGKPDNVEAIKADNVSLLAELKLIFPQLKSNSIKDFENAAKRQRKAYDKTFNKEAQDEAKRKLKEGMVIVAKDSSGNRVGVVKSLNNSNVRGRGRAQMDHLRSSLLEQVLKNKFKKGTKTKFKVPVQIVYMGIPNIRTENGEKINYRFSEEKGDLNINPSKIKSVGYVTYNKLQFSDNRKIDTPYNYAKAILNDETFKGVRVPVVSFMHQGKEIIYPISLIERNTESASDEFNKLLEQKDSMMVGEFILAANEFLAEKGVEKSVRLTSLNLDSELQNVTDRIAGIRNIPSIDELMDSSNVSNILMESAFIDINLNDKPFAGPKVRFDLNSVPQTESKYLEKESILDNLDSDSVSDIDNEINNQNCMD